MLLPRKAMPPALLAPEPGAETSAPFAPPPKKRRPVRRLLFLVLAVSLVWLLYQIYYIFLGPNFHEVLPGKAYRSSQPSPERLKNMVRRHGIKTVINLRGVCVGQPWYMEQCEAVLELGISQEDLTFSAQRLPSAPELIRLIEVLDRTEYPILLHCRQGADRTGLAAAIIRLLYSEDNLEEALGQVGYRYGHLPVGKTLYMDRFFDLYTHWLRQGGKSHAPPHFRHWIANEYRGAWCQYALEAFVPLQEKAWRGEPLGYRLRVRNTSSHTWHFRPHDLAGIHVGAELLGPDNTLLRMLRAGQFERDVAPNETIEVTLVIPPLESPGRYLLRLDMLDEGHCLFLQAGAQAREEEIVVHE